MELQKIMNALSDPIRREIIILLRSGKMSAGNIAKEIGMTSPALSYHLKKLKAAELIYEIKYKNFIYYELDTTVLDEILLWFIKLKGDKNE